MEHILGLKYKILMKEHDRNIRSRNHVSKLKYITIKNTFPINKIKDLINFEVYLSVPLKKSKFYGYHEININYNLNIKLLRKEVFNRISFKK